MILTNHGTQIPTCVNVAHLQELPKPVNALVQHQRLNGMPTPKHAAAHQILTVITVSLAQPHDSGIRAKINVSAQPQKPNGIHQHNNVNVQLESMEITVLNALLQDIGM